MTKPAARYYDELSLNYDLITSKQGVWVPPEIMAQQIAPLLNDGDKILDIGIGTGQLIGCIKETGKNIQIEGVEISEKMRDICISKYPDIILHHGDILEINLTDINHFDMITICGALEFIPELDLLLEKCWALLSKSGYLVFTYEPVIIGHKIQGKEKALTVSSYIDKNQYLEDFFTYRYHPWQISQKLTEAGFKLQSEIEFIAYKKQEIDIIYHLIIARKIDN